MSDQHLGSKAVHPLLLLPYYIYKYLVIIPVLILSTAVLSVPITILCLAGAPDFASRVFATLWARFNALVTLLGISVHGSEHIKPGQSYVVVANHQSLLDIYAIYGFAGIELKWVMKQELRKVPILGTACALMGHIYIDRSNTDAALASINNARQKIRGGMCVVFFPEGTRSAVGELGNFKKGAFRLAIELGIPVLPISIDGTNRVLPANTMDWYPGQADMRIHEPIDTADMTAQDLNALSQRAKAAIESGLQP